MALGDTRGEEEGGRGREGLREASPAALPCSPPRRAWERGAGWEGDGVWGEEVGSKGNRDAQSLPGRRQRHSSRRLRLRHPLGGRAGEACFFPYRRGWVESRAWLILREGRFFIAPSELAGMMATVDLGLGTVGKQKFAGMDTHSPSRRWGIIYRNMRSVLCYRKADREEGVKTGGSSRRCGLVVAERAAGEPRRQRRQQRGPAATVALQSRQPCGECCSLHGEGASLGTPVRHKPRVR